MTTAAEVKALAEAAPVLVLRSEPVGATGEVWLPIIPLGAPADLPVFPVQALPEVFRAFAAESAASRQIALDYPSTIILGFAALACARRYRVQIGDSHSAPCNLYILTLMDPGERKTDTFRDAASPVNAYEEELRQMAKVEIQRAEEAFRTEEMALQAARKKLTEAGNQEEMETLKASIEEQAANRTVIPTMPRLQVGDVTPEMLVMLMAENGSRIAQVDAEGGTFFQMIAGRYSKTGQGNYEAYLSGHSGDAIRVDRVGRPSLNVQNPALTLILSGQPDLLRSLKDKREVRARGLLGRFMYSMPKSLAGTRMYINRPVAAQVRGAYAQELRRMLETPSLATNEDPDCCRVLRLSNGALAIWKRYADESELELASGGSLSGMKDWASKLPGAVARIAGLLHVMANAAGEDISVQTVSDAWNIGHYFRDHAIYAYDLMEGDPDVARARRVLAWIRRHGRQTFRVAEVYDDLRHGGETCSSEDLKAPLADLVDRNFIREAPAPPRQRGRPLTPGYEVNPLTHEAGGRSA